MDPADPLRADALWSEATAAAKLAKLPSSNSKMGSALLWDAFNLMKAHAPSATQPSVSCSPMEFAPFPTVSISTLMDARPVKEVWLPALGDARTPLKEFASSAKSTNIWRLTANVAPKAFIAPDTRMECASAAAKTTSSMQQTHANRNSLAVYTQTVSAAPASRPSPSATDSASSTDVLPTMPKAALPAIPASCSTASSAPFLSAKK